MRSENSKVYVNKTINSGNKSGPSVGGDSQDEDVIAVHKFQTETARVTVDYALTINLGNYESAKIGVSVSVPCYVEEMSDAYEFAQAWAEERLSQERDMIISGRKSQKG